MRNSPSLSQSSIPDTNQPLRRSGRSKNILLSHDTTDQSPRFPSSPTAKQERPKSAPPRARKPRSISASPSRKGKTISASTSAEKKRAVSASPSGRKSVSESKVQALDSAASLSSILNKLVEVCADESISNLSLKKFISSRTAYSEQVVLQIPASLISSALSDLARKRTKLATHVSDDMDVVDSKEESSATIDRSEKALGNIMANGDYIYDILSNENFVSIHKLIAHPSKDGTTTQSYVHECTTETRAGTKHTVFHHELSDQLKQQGIGYTRQGSYPEEMLPDVIDISLRPAHATDTEHGFSKLQLAKTLENLLNVVNTPNPDGTPHPDKIKILENLDQYAHFIKAVQLSDNIIALQFTRLFYMAVDNYDKNLAKIAKIWNLIKSVANLETFIKKNKEKFPLANGVRESVEQNPAPDFFRDQFPHTAPTAVYVDAVMAKFHDTFKLLIGFDKFYVYFLQLAQQVQRNQVSPGGSRSLSPNSTELNKQLTMFLQEAHNALSGSISTTKAAHLLPSRPIPITPSATANSTHSSLFSPSASSNLSNKSFSSPTSAFSRTSSSHFFAHQDDSSRSSDAPTTNTSMPIDDEPSSVLTVDPRAGNPSAAITAPADFLIQLTPESSKRPRPSTTPRAAALHKTHEEPGSLTPRLAIATATKIDNALAELRERLVHAYDSSTKNGDRALAAVRTTINKLEPADSSHSHAPKSFGM